MQSHTIAIAIALSFVVPSSAQSQTAQIKNAFNPDAQTSQPSPDPNSCREVLAIAMLEEGQPFDPRTQNILDITIAETDGIIDPESGNVLSEWLTFKGEERQSIAFLDDRLIPVEADIYARSELAEDAARAIARSRLSPLCQQPMLP
jgi:hypothetical protein